MFCSFWVSLGPQNRSKNSLKWTRIGLRALEIGPKASKIGARAVRTDPKRSKSVKRSTKDAQERSKRRQSGPRKGQNQKKLTGSQKKFLRSRGSAEARSPTEGGGGKPPEFGGSPESTKHYLKRFATVVNDGCGGLSSLRATAAPELESDV